MLLGVYEVHVMTLAVSRSGVRSAEKTLCSAYTSADPFRVVRSDVLLVQDGTPMIKKFTTNPKPTITQAIPRPIPTVLNISTRELYVVKVAQIIPNSRDDVVHRHIHLILVRSVSRKFFDAQSVER
jgi:hypothetical protein